MLETDSVYSSISGNETVRIEMPDKESIVKFKNRNREIRVPFVIYADFDACTKPINNCEPSSDDSFTSQYQKQKPCVFCDHVVCFDNDIDTLSASIMSFILKSQLSTE